MTLARTDDELTRHSYYAATAPRWQSHAPLQGQAQVDVAVVGAGLAGLSAALDLAELGHRVCVMEAHHVGFGASGRNGGQAIHGLACDQEVIESQLGKADARKVWDMSIEALDVLRQRIERHGIDCDWRDGFLGVAVGERKAKHLADWADRLQREYGYALDRIAKPDLPAWINSPRYHGAVHDPRSGHLHPLKYTQGLARAALRAGVTLYENARVTRIEPGPTVTLHTGQGSVRAKHVLLAGNVYLQDLAPSLQARIMPVGTYIVASEVLAPEQAQALIPCGAAVCDTNFVLDYFRTSADHRVIFGGRVSYSTKTPMNMAGSMRRRMEDAFPQLAHVQTEFAWGGFVDITMNRAPDFGRLPSTGYAPNIYYLQGFSGHGLALTGLAGSLVAEAIHGDASRLDVFARLKHRPFPGGAALRTPALVLGMAWYRLKDALG